MSLEDFSLSILSSVLSGIVLLFIGGLVAYFKGKYIYDKFYQKFNTKIDTTEVVNTDYDKGNFGGKRYQAARDLYIVNIEDSRNTSASKVDLSKILDRNK